MASLPSFIELTEHGPFCRPGGFHIDPWRPVPRAVITHAHSDHAVRGCSEYLASKPCAPLLRARLGAAISLRTLAYAESADIGDVKLSLHPAGHVLGSSQVRIEYKGHVIVFSGDYKLDADPTAAAFEPVRCHTFVSESTFGLPIFRWPDQHDEFERINTWWRGNQRDGRTSVLLVYSLGKAQRVMCGLDSSIGPIGVHGAMVAINEAYEHAGVTLPHVVHANPVTAKDLKGQGIILTPTASGESVWLRKLAGPDGLSMASVSGWMLVRGARRRQALDRGFPISDHADWDALHRAIAATGAEHVGITHGSTDVMTRWLREHSVDAFVVPTRYTGETAETETDEAAQAQTTPENASDTPAATEPPDRAASTNGGAA